MNSEISLSVSDEFLDDLAARVARQVADQLSDGRARSRSPWLDVRGAATYAAMTEQAVRAALKRGELKSYRSGRRVRLPVEDVDTFLKGDEVRPRSTNPS
jgi:excisionase family DNA binding protein